MEKVIFKSGKLDLEGIFSRGLGNNSALVTHPHPLYGGEMYNNVVSAVCEAYNQNGYGTLRFNFRGVGRSEGEYDNGDGEKEDVRSALEYLISLGYRKIDVTGYSFGSWVNALAIKSLKEASRFIFVSPPVSMMDFSFLEFDPRIRLVISADNDEYADIQVIEQMLPSWNPSATFKIVRGSDHFYSGRERELKSIISEFLAHADSIEDSINQT